ncbi:MAG: hypothetical protein GY778_08280 [bacterium]|nr:hypothetical protein [bacterium]
MADGTFATAVNCIDGRVQEPVTRWMCQRLGVDFVDLVTEAGPDGVLTHGRTADIESIRRRVTVSLTKHHSSAVAVVGHHDCAANPVAADTHRDQIHHAVDIVRSWMLPASLFGLWVDERWAVEEVCHCPSPQ